MLVGADWFQRAPCAHTVPDPPSHSGVLVLPLAVVALGRDGQCPGIRIL